MRFKRFPLSRVSTSKERKDQTLAMWTARRTKPKILGQNLPAKFERKRLNFHSSSLSSQTILKRDLRVRNPSWHEPAYKFLLQAFTEKTMQKLARGEGGKQVRVKVEPYRLKILTYFWSGQRLAHFSA